MRQHRIMLKQAIYSAGFLELNFENLLLCMCVKTENSPFFIKVI